MIPPIAGFESDGKWLVERKERAVVDRMRDTPPPRRHGLLDQLRIDLAAPLCCVMYAVVVGSVVAAIVFSSIVSAIVGALVTAMLARGFVDALATVRHGMVGTARIARIQHDHSSYGINEDVSVDGRPMKLRYELAPVRAILTAGCDVEMQVVYVPRRRKPFADAMTYRPVARAGRGASTPETSPARPLSTHPRAVA